MLPITLGIRLALFDKGWAIPTSPLRPPILEGRLDGGLLLAYIGSGTGDLIDMSLILYSSRAGTENGLQDLLQSVFPKKELEVCKTQDSLCQRLKQCFDGMAVVVLIAANRDELYDLLAFDKLLSDLRIILILPDRDKDAVRRAHALRPRFITYADGNLEDVAAVVEKMLGLNTAGGAADGLIPQPE